MAQAILDIKNWGNGLGVRLPKIIAKAAHLHSNQRVTIHVENDKIIITPLPTPSLSLQERLARFDPEQHSGEVMQNEARLGAEQW